MPEGHEDTKESLTLSAVYPTVRYVDGVYAYQSSSSTALTRSGSEAQVIN